MNLQLRTKVMECALMLEKGISELLFMCFSLEKGKNELNAFGNKSSNITFKNKIDVLKDIGIFNSTKDDDSYTPFEAVMEFRNKFLHVYECDSFMAAYESMNKNTKLTNYRTDKKSPITESVLSHTFDIVYAKCQKIIEEKEQMIYDNQRQREQHMNTIVKGIQYYLANNSVLCQKIMAKINRIDTLDDATKKALNDDISKKFTMNDVVLNLLYDNFADSNVTQKYFDLINSPKYKALNHDNDES